MKAFFLCIGLFLTTFSFANTDNPIDSVGIRWVDGKPYIMHKVERGEGLYAIARRYNRSVDAIRKANPTVGDGLTLGQIVLVPRDPENTPVKPEEPKKEDPKKAEPKKEEPKKEDPKNADMLKHTVKAGETLFSISRAYDVSVSDLRKINDLKSDNLVVGQELIIREGNKPPVHTENYGGREKPDPKKEEPKVEVNVKNDNYEYNSATGEVKETGLAVVAINESINHDRSFCLHPTAPTGTIIMVTNTQNNKSVFVRVVGKPLDTEDRVVIKITQSAAKRIGLDDNDQAPVRLNYAK